MSLLTFAKIAMRNLFSKPVTTNYPFEPATYPERNRGHIELDFDACILCGNCARHCPTETIKVDRKTGTWSMNRFDCVQCANCVQVCPKKCLTIVPGYFTPGVEKVVETYERPVEAPKAAAAAGPAVPAANMDKCKLCGLCAKNCPNECITVDRKAKTWSVNAADCVGCGACQSSCHFDAITMGAAAAEPAGDPVAHADLSKCKFCGLCAKNCPNECITVDRKAKTWTVNADECVGCGACQSACHFDAITIGAAPAAAPAEEKKEEAPAAENTKVIKLPGRRPLTVQLKADGKEVAVPACIRPEYNDQWADLPKCDPEKCKYCTLCAKKCPKGAIEVDRKEKFWEVDNSQCVRCGICLENCNFGALSMKE